VNWHIVVERPLTCARWETATPMKQAVVHLAMITVGRWCRGLMRRLLQRRLITGRDDLPISLSRSFERIDSHAPLLRVTDTITLTDRKRHVARMMFSVGLQSAYTAASGIYQDAVLQPWTDLSSHVDQLNRDRTVTIVREFPA
jgi:hypothetical protein